MLMLIAALLSACLCAAAFALCERTEAEQER